MRDDRMCHFVERPLAGQRRRSPAMAAKGCSKTPKPLAVLYPQQSISSDSPLTGLPRSDQSPRVDIIVRRIPTGVLPFYGIARTPTNLPKTVTTGALGAMHLLAEYDDQGNLLRSVRLEAAADSRAASF
jgi:hypothetical protein